MWSRSRIRAVQLGALMMIAAAVLACGSAAEAPSSGWEDFAAGGNDPMAPTQVIASYDVVVDPGGNGLSYSPRTALGEIAQNLFLNEAHDDFLAVTANVTFYDGWNTSTFDSQSNVIYLYDPTLSPPCLQNPSGTQHIHGLKAAFYAFTDNNVVMSPEATSNSGRWEVDFQELPAGDLVCRSLSLTNTSSTAYRAKLNFEATSIDTTPAAAVLGYPAVNEWTIFGGSWATNVVGKNFAGSAVSGLGYLFVNGVDMASIGTVNVTSGASGNITFTTSSAVPSAGFMTVATQSNGTLTGPYIRQPQGLKANLKLPSGQGTKTRKVFWKFCNGTCAINMSTNCMASANDREVISNVTLNDATGTTVYMNFLSSIVATSTILVGFDLNNNNTLDSGDLVTNSGGATTQGMRTDLGNLTLSDTLTASCP